jgi:hypothetical protein
MCAVTATATQFLVAEETSTYHHTAQSKAGMHEPFARLRWHGETHHYPAGGGASQ